MLFPNGKHLAGTIRILALIPLTTGLLALPGVHDPIYQLPAKPDLVALPYLMLWQKHIVAIKPNLYRE